MNRRTFSKLIGGAAGYSILPAQAIGPFGVSRIAYSCDGNYHDVDDFGAAPMVCALLSDAGESYRLVHFDFNSNRLNHKNTMANQMRKSMFGDSTIVGAVSRFNMPPRFYDSQYNFSGAVSNLKNEILQSTAANRLIFCLGGPAEVLYQALQGVPNSARQYVRVISHSSQFNENTGPHSLAQCTGVIVERIPNQNSRLNTKQNWGPWNWLNNKPNNKFLFDRMKASGRADVSDSGMMYYILYGNKNATPNDYKGKLA